MRNRLLILLLITIPSVVLDQWSKFADVAPIVEQRCAACHAENPSITRFGKPAGNVLLETPEQIQALASRIKARSVQTQGMPVANMTNMTASERELLGRWIDEGANLE